MSNEGGRALVTGSSSGIGLAIVRRLLADGWQVCGLDVAEPVIEDARFQPITVDLADGPALEAVLADIVTVQAVVHAAGLLRPASLGSLDSANGEAMWRVHVQAAAQIANRLLPAMAQARQGRVVLVASRVARGVAGRSQYA